MEAISSSEEFYKSEKTHAEIMDKSVTDLRAFTETLVNPTDKQEFIELLDELCVHTNNLLTHVEEIGTTLQANAIKSAKEESLKLRAKAISDHHPFTQYRHQ